MNHQPFYFTFSQRFRIEPHPASDSLGVPIHPDGYVTVMAGSAREAWDIATSTLKHWSMMNVHQPPVEFFPRGNLTTIQ